MYTMVQLRLLTSRLNEYLEGVDFQFYATLHSKRVQITGFDVTGHTVQVYWLDEEANGHWDSLDEATVARLCMQLLATA